VAAAIHVFGFGEEASLSVAERIEAASRGIERGGGLRVSLSDIALVLACALFLVWAALCIGRRLRRTRWIAHHASRLIAAGLQSEEVQVFRRIAQVVRSGAVPLLSRQRSVFDEGCAALIARQRVAERRHVLSEALSLRRRVPFESRPNQAPAFVPGDAVELWLVLAGAAPLSGRAFVVAVLPNGLQLAFEPGTVDGALDAALQVGQAVKLVVSRDRRLTEARVRIRGRATGQSLQLLVDRPDAEVAARVRIAWTGVDETVRVELVERFSDKVIGEAIPQVEARVVGSCSDGLLIQFESTRPRHSEAIHVLDGARPGFYRGFATLETHGRGGTVFVIQRSGERVDASAKPAKERRRHEPVQA